MNKYKLAEEIYYFSIEQNNKMFNGNQSIGLIPNSVEESSITAILEYLLGDGNNYFIIDFSNIFSITFTETQYSLILNEKFALLGINEKYLKTIKKQAQKNGKPVQVLKYVANKEKSCYLLYFSDNLENVLVKFLRKFVPDQQLHMTVDVELSQKLVAHIVAGILIKDIEYYNLNNLKYLESSNVFVNCYLNVKRLFLNIDVLIMVVNQLKAIIQNKFLKEEEKSDICLLGVSNNGIILSRILAYVMQVKVKSINHVGPKYCLDYDNTSAEQYKNQKFILVSDVICLGGEYRMAKGMIGVLNSELLGAVGIVKIRDVYRGDENKFNPIYAIIDNINEYGCDYRVYIDKEEI